MKKTLFMALAVVGTVASAQETVSDSTKHWSIVGQTHLCLTRRPSLTG